MVLDRYKEVMTLQEVKDDIINKLKDKLNEMTKDELIKYIYELEYDYRFILDINYNISMRFDTVINLSLQKTDVEILEKYIRETEIKGIDEKIKKLYDLAEIKRILKLSG